MDHRTIYAGAATEYDLYVTSNTAQNDFAGVEVRAQRAQPRSDVADDVEPVAGGRCELEPRAPAVRLRSKRVRRGMRGELSERVVRPYPELMPAGRYRWDNEWRAAADPPAAIDAALERCDRGS